MSDVGTSSEGLNLVKQWEGCHVRLDRLKRDVANAECDLENAKNALAVWVCPEDAKVDETFSIWAFGGLLLVTKTGQNDYSVKWRQEPKRV